MNLTLPLVSTRDRSYSFDSFPSLSLFHFLISLFSFAQADEPYTKFSALDGRNASNEEARSDQTESVSGAGRSFIDASFLVCAVVVNITCDEKTGHGQSVAPRPAPRRSARVFLETDRISRGRVIDLVTMRLASPLL